MDFFLSFSWLKLIVILSKKLSETWEWRSYTTILSCSTLSHRGIAFRIPTANYFKLFSAQRNSKTSPRQVLILLLCWVKWTMYFQTLTLMIVLSLMLISPIHCSINAHLEVQTSKKQFFTNLKWSHVFLMEHQCQRSTFSQESMKYNSLQWLAQYQWTIGGLHLVVEIIWLL